MYIIIFSIYVDAYDLTVLCLLFVGGGWKLNGYDCFSGLWNVIMANLLLNCLWPVGM